MTAKPVGEVVAELLAVKGARKASGRYLQDLRSRLGWFAAAFHKNAGDVTTAELQAWLDAQKLALQTYTNFKRVVHSLFAFAVTRGYAADNPAEGVEAVKVNGGKVEVFTPAEPAKLLAAASPEFRPCIVLGGPSFPVIVLGFESAHALSLCPTAKWHCPGATRSEVKSLATRCRWSAGPALQSQRLPR